MSTPDQPETPPLTRRQLREIRNTGATPIIPPAGEPETRAEAEPSVEAEPQAEAEPSVEAEPQAEAEPSVEAELDSPVESEPETEAEPEAAEVVEEPAPATPSAPSALAAEPAFLAPVPPLDANVDLGASALTRRQAREQERIRTASVPVITPDVVLEPMRGPEPVVVPDFAVEPAAEEVEAEPVDVEVEPVDLHTPDDLRSDEADEDAAEPAAPEPIAAAPVVDPNLGSGLLAGGSPVVTFPPSFDSLIARTTTTTGSVATPNALILSQTPSVAPLVGPVTATGEVLITGTFDLPEGLGSVGHAPGATDGKDIDVALVDGELPPASSPTPIAASAAISTVRSSDEIIRPPAPEKGNRLILALAITAGVLAVALAGVLILAIATGMFA